MTPLRSSSQPEGLYRILVETVRDYAIFALDTRGNISSWNRGAELLKGYRAEQVIGKHFSIFYPPEDIAWDKPGFELKEVLREGRFEDEGWRVRADGSRFWANVIITALHDETGTLIGFAKVTRDLTDRRRAELRAIDDARRIAAAEAASRTRGDFLATLSHELRTPLNAIGGYVELLLLGLRGPLSEEQRSDLERIHRSQHHLLSIINDLLNFSRIEAGQLSYDIEEISLSDAVSDVVRMIEPQALRKKLNLHVDAGAGEVRARADLQKVDQIVLNLLTNAIKFTPEGGSITVTLSRNAHTASVRVADTGPGIPADQIEKIFEPFVQLGRSLTSSHEGTGLGLAISRDLARGMNGELTADSQPGSGAAFALTLPSA